MQSSRRRFVQSMGAVGLGLVAGCGLPVAQPATSKVYRIGFLSNGASEFSGTPAASAPLDALRQGLRVYGYVEGQNLSLTSRSTPQGESRLGELAAELVGLPVDVLLVAGVGGGAGPALAAKQATRTVPIVLVGGGDPVALGLVASLARPGGNVTGVSADIQGGLFDKRLELLKDAAPGLTRVAVLEDATLAASGPVLASRAAAAQALGLQLAPVLVGSPTELDSAFERAAQAHADGLLVVEQPSLTPIRTRIASLALSYQLPSMGQFREFAGDGGLMAYGPLLPALYRHVASYVDRLFKGASPADLPVEQPREFDLAINFKTAHALGLTTPPSVLLQATEVIQ